MAEYSDRKAIWFQGPSGGITDPKAFKRALTKKYREARSSWGPDVKVMYRGSDTSQADKLIKEWGSEGYTRYLRPKKLHKDPDTNKLYNKKYGDLLFQTDKKGMPIRESDPINISSIEIPKGSKRGFVENQLNRWKENKQLVNQFSFNRKGNVVYPGKATKKHFARFEELTKSTRQGGLGLKEGFEAYLDELEDIGTGSTKQAPDKPKKLSIKGAKVTKLPVIGAGQGEVTKVKSDIDSMLAGLQVAREKSGYYSLSQGTLDRIENLEKTIRFPVKSGQYLAEDVVDNEGERYIETEDAVSYEKPQAKVKGSKVKLSAKTSATDELKPDVQEDLESDDMLQLTKVDEADISADDKAIRKENFKLDKLGKIKTISGEVAWNKFISSPASKRIFMNILGDVHKVSSTLGITSSDVDKKKEQTTKVIDSPNKKGVLIRADPSLLKNKDPKIRERVGQRLKLEKKYIYKNTHSKQDIRKGIADDKKQAKFNRVGKKISRLRSSGDRALKNITNYINSDKLTHAKTSGAKRYGLMPWMVESEKTPTKTFIKPSSYKKSPTILTPDTKMVTTEVTPNLKKVTSTGKPKTKAVTAASTRGETVATRIQKRFKTKANPSNVEYKHRSTDKKHSSVGKGIKFTRGLGAFSMFSSILGLVRAKKEATQTLRGVGINREPSVMETLEHTMPKYARRKYYKIPDA